MTKPMTPSERATVIQLLRDKDPAIAERVANELDGDPIARAVDRLTSEMAASREATTAQTEKLADRVTAEVTALGARLTEEMKGQRQLTRVSMTGLFVLCVICIGVAAAAIGITLSVDPGNGGNVTVSPGFSIEPVERPFPAPPPPVIDPDRSTM